MLALLLLNDAGLEKEKSNAARRSERGALLTINALAPELFAALTYSAPSLKVSTTMAIDGETFRTHETRSKPDPSGKFTSTIIASGFVCAIKAWACLIELATATT